MERYFDPTHAATTKSVLLRNPPNQPQAKMHSIQTSPSLSVETTIWFPC
jgi:hypothetical protein